ncbi:MAG TPA: hypothetical protein VMV10_05205 [Pirellulales bacterium]|nr:hypothetical protein [Pirellulales bacterium]
MNIKTSRNLTSSLKGSAFRRAACDARSWWVRRIVTMRTREEAKVRTIEGAGPPW